jgi:hypothetical protein
MSNELVTETPSEASAARHRGLTPGPLLKSPFVSFAPWIIFWVVSGAGTWEVACVSALLAAVLLLVIDMAPAEHPTGPRLRFRAPKILDAGTVLFFLAFSILSIFVPRSALLVLEQYAQAISNAALGLIVLVPLLLGHPFTEAYAKESTPEAVWHLPAFHHTNLVISWVWCAVFAVCALLGLLAQASWVSPGLQNWLNYYLPIALVILAFRFDVWYPARVRARAIQAASAPAPS